MKPRSSAPIRVRTYAALTPWLDGVRGGKINLLFLVGTPGLGKTRLVHAALAGHEHLLIAGHATPLMMYAELYRHRDRTVVVDDEDSVHADPQKLRLMKCLCDSEPVKRLAWQSTSKLLSDLGVPLSFETTSKVVVVTNHLAAATPHVAALFDRGNVVSFEPSAAEVHSRVAGWLGDAEILDHFARWLRVIPEPSMRQYVKAAERKAAGIDWRATLAAEWKAGKLFLIDELQRDPAFHTEEERAAAFVARRGGSRATYFRHLKRWRQVVGEPAPPPPLPLTALRTVMG